MKRALICALSLFIALFISACEDGKKPQLVTTVTPLANVGPAGGIERISLSHPLVNTVYHVYSKDLGSKYLIPDVRGEINNKFLSDGEQIYFDQVEENPLVEVISIKHFQEDVALHGKQFDITRYSSINRFAQVYFAYSDSELVDIMTYGSRAMGLPTGRSTYHGANILTVSGTEIYEGEFHLLIDFETGTGFLKDLRISSDVPDSYYAVAEISESIFVRLSGTFRVNAGNGTFSGIDMKLHNCDKQECNRFVGGVINDYVDHFIEEREASIYGSLHGEGGSGLTAIYHDNPTENSVNPKYIGALVGQSAE